MKNYKYILLLFSIAIMTSCSDEWLDVNTNPNSPVEVDPFLKLPVALDFSAKTITSAVNDRDGNRMGRGSNALGNLMMNNWSQSDGYAWYPDEFEYQVTSGFYETVWDFPYKNTLPQFDSMDDGVENHAYYRAIAKIMKTLHFQMLTDAYGDIPYSEALQRGLNTTPKYDKSEDVYTDLIVQLDNAIELINTAGNDVITPSSDDVMFNGDMTKWKQLANSLKLRILVRQIDVPSKSAYLTTEFSKIENDGSGFLVEDATVNPGYSDENDKQNPFWGYMGYDTSGGELNNHKATCASEYVITKLNDYGDPRIDFIYALPTAGGAHKGVKQGTINYPDGYLSENLSLIGAGLLKSASQDAVIFSLSESFFLQAEAQLKGFLSGSVESSFDAGVQASFSYLGAGDASSYTSNGNENSDYSASSNKLETIIIQKWIAANGINAIQSWFDFTRTGYPNDMPLSSEATPSITIPVRLHYPKSETNFNGDNLPSQPNVFTDKPFWALN